MSYEWEKVLKILYRLIEFNQKLPMGHYNSFILIGLQVMLPEQTILPQGVEGETLHQIISPLFDEYL